MSKLSELKRRYAEVDALRAATAIMEWDQQTLMPEGGAEARAQHLGILSRMAHETFTDEKTHKLVEQAVSDATNEDDQALIRVVKRDLDLSTKLPADLVERKSSLAAKGHEVWVEARRENSFPKFAPILEEMVAICQEEARHLGYSAHIYDALTDLYEEGATKASWDVMFDGIREPMRALVQAIGDMPEPDDSWLYGTWPEADQRQYTDMLVEAIGFDMKRGRQDTAPHPFCTNWSVGDVRLTTRFKDYLPSAIFGSLHEAGHGMYEQGSPFDWDMTPLCGGVSLGFHESQSRTWENIVGRSTAFWKHFLPGLKQAFPSLPDVGLDTFVRAVNKVKPSLIRVEADEVTYNLHIMVRYEAECALLTGSLAAKDLPAWWNAKYAEIVGITPPDDAQGCLQDVHWSGGSFGYFPTYSMGNILSYQIWESLKTDIADPDSLMAQGNFKPIFEWLLEKVYRQGKKYTPKELTERVTGKPLGPDAYVNGMTAKYAKLYGLQLTV